jgi:hypothetical protein
VRVFVVFEQKLDSTSGAGAAHPPPHGPCIERGSTFKQWL